jgi:hypothetical protein
MTITTALRNWGQHTAQADRIAATFDSTRMLIGPVTEKQKNFIRSLLTQLKDIKPDVYATAFTYVQQHAKTMTKEQGRDIITRLKGHVNSAPTQPTVNKVDSFTDIPDGYYAITADEGHTSFYRVSTFKETPRYPVPGRRVQLQMSDALQNMSRVIRDTVLRKIRDAGPKAAAERYAREIGNCYSCGRTLTNDESRAVGIGPTCRSKVTW